MITIFCDFRQFSTNGGPLIGKYWYVYLPIGIIYSFLECFIAAWYILYRNFANFCQLSNNHKYMALCVQMLLFGIVAFGIGGIGIMCADYANLGLNFG
jgi:hypothetical protein